MLLGLMSGFYYSWLPSLISTIIVALADFSLCIPLSHLEKVTHIATLLVIAADPRVLEHLVGSHALLGISHKNLLDQLDGALRHGLPDVIVKIVLALLDELEEYEVVIVVERRHSTEEDVEHNTDTPVVTLLTVGFLLQDLRGDIAWGTTGGLGHGLLTDETGQTEVSHLDHGSGKIFGSQQQVLGLDVSVDDAKGVAVLESINDRSNDVTSFFLGELLSLHEHIEELAALHDLHDKVVVFGIFVNIMHLYNIRVVNLL